MQIEKKRPRIGDVLEMETPNGLAYFQYTFKHTAPPVYGELIRVLPGLYKSRPSDFSHLVSEKERFFVFYPVGRACSKGLIAIVAHEDIPEWAQGMPLMRKAGWRHKSGEVLNWWLWDGEKASAIDELTPEQRHLSLAEIWNHEMLVQRIAKGWSPSDGPTAGRSPEIEQSKNGKARSFVPGDQAVLDELIQAGSDLNLPHRIRHYLYFPTKDAADQVAEKLRSENYSVELRRGADDESWLVLASHLVIPSIEVITGIRSHLETVALSMQGEYDGWEAAVAK